MEKRAKRADESQRCCLNRALGYLYAVSYTHLIDFQTRDSIGILPIFQCIVADIFDLSQIMLVLI